VKKVVYLGSVLGPRGH